ncbi:metallopeptidase family protein [Ornithinimicrobium faecis]|uniref:Metallopeptidase family protein n=1 Tax=Ornithinimicrobium faecis TaxID=2934158 RepID=A0ABY4YPM7_9MICO|nr:MULTISPECIES: metallopeptidase family protein [unclassified Ornithinimicrobium]USQ78731.1 metallopeptidase family protein [Ornithinimicrobium sp. HY1793]
MARWSPESALRRRDRHGRGLRGPLAWPPVPAMRTRSGRFDDLVLDAIQLIEHRLGRDLSDLEVAVEEVPPADPAPWESGIALGRLFPAEGSLPARVVVYRRPVESRGQDDELAALVHEVLAEQVASMLGIDPEDLL